MEERKIVPQMLRLPRDVRDRLRDAATAERRSMNSQIVVLLERALAAKGKTGEDVIAHA